MKKIILLICLLLLASILNAQSTDQNYIQTKTYLDETQSKYIEQIAYYDGLGRPIQAIQKGITPNRTDLATYQQYDVYGRESQSWLAVPMASSNNGSYVQLSTIRQKAQEYYSDSHAYLLPTYEQSPLNRLVAQTGPGEKWHTAEKAVRTEYLANVDANDVDNKELVCKLFHATNNRDSYAISHPGRQLTTTVTENGVERQVALTSGGFKLISGIATHYDAGQLFVTKMTDEEGNAAYEFKDKLVQVVLTRQIDGQQMFDTYYVYDIYGNLRAVLPPLASDLLTGNNWDENEPVLQKYAYLYKYDARNRCIEKKLPGCDLVKYVYDKADRLIYVQDGEMRQKGVWMFTIPDAFGRISLTGTTSQMTDVSQTIIKATYDNSDKYYGYAIEGLTLPEIKIHTVNYYDNYNFLALDGFNNNYTFRDGANATGLQTGSIAFVPEDGSIKLCSAVYYDYKGNPVKSISGNHVGGHDITTTTYSFTNTPLTVEQTHTRLNNSGVLETKELFYRYSYDHANRMDTVRFYMAPGDTVLLAANEYDELGRLKNVKRNNNANLMDSYAYNVRSWITGISGKQFTESLAYQYNGNVQSMGWQTGNRQRSYTYEYDGLSRLKQAIYDAQGTNEKYGTSYSYDKHGNLTALTRSGKTTATAYGMVDNLSMAYTGNQLMGVNDSGVTVSLPESSDFKKGSTASVQYAYNKNGAMTKDLNKKITEISYNSLNLPKELVINGVTNTYTYSADGRKLRVKQENDICDYVGSFIYENGSLKRILVEGGYIENDVVHFYFNDHLGNVRAVANASGATVQKNDYYPFGLPMAEVSDSEQDKQPYKYNGKEFDRKKGLNLYDYGARQMDPAIGRFTTMDRFAEKYYNISPYAYVNNNPMRFVDVRGDSLTLVGSTSDIHATTRVYNSGLGGYYTTSVDANGKASISQNTGVNPNNMTNQQKAYYSALDQVISGTDGMTTINVVNGTAVVIGDINTSTIDIGDIQALGNGTDINQGSALLHETVEQYGIQVKGQSSIAAHLRASGVERIVTGSYVDPINRQLIGGQMSIPILDPLTGSTIKTVTIYVNHAGNVTGIRR